jgi:hypothetical protein
MNWQNKKLSSKEDSIRFALQYANLINLQVPNGKKQKRKAISYIIQILQKMGESKRAAKLQTEMDKELGKPEIASIEINFLI